MRALALAVVCLSLLAGCAASPSPAPSVPPPKHLQVATDRRLAASTAVLASVLDPTLPGCSAAVAVHGVVVWADALGAADLSTGAPLTADTRFDMASETKQFTATAILMLERQGLLSLDDPIASYVDGLPAWGKRITLDELMHHTSHIPDYWRQLQNWGYGFTTPATQKDALRAIAAVTRFEPGEGYLYSNSNYILLSAVIERVSGQSYPDYITEKIFAPLGLDLTIDPVLQAPDIAVSYDDTNTPSRNAWDFYGAFGTFSTASELARWGDQYRDGPYVQNDFLTGAVDSGEPGESTEGRLYAAGMNVEASGALRHDGRMGGFITTFKVSPDRETTLVVMCNGHLADRAGVTSGLWKIWVSSTPAGD